MLSLISFNPGGVRKNLFLMQNYVSLTILELKSLIVIKHQAS